MPRDYGKVSHRFWTGDTGKKIRVLGLETRVIATYLVTCGSSNMIGLYYLPMTLISHETGIPLEGASKALRSLGEVGFAHYDEAEEMVFVPHMAREQIGETLKAGDKQRFGVIGLLKENQKSRFYNDFIATYRVAFHLEELELNEAPSKDLPSPIRAPSKPENREQEQRTGAGAPSKGVQPSAKIRPRTAHDLEHCLRVAIQREQPQNGIWNPGGSFAAKEAREFLDGFGDDLESALETIEARIELFAKDATMSPWTIAKFAKAYNGIGQPKKEARADGQQAGPKPFRWPELKVPAPRKVASP